MSRKYRLERWISFLLVTLFFLPFVGAAEDFYNGAQRARTQHQRMAPKPPRAGDRVSLPEEGQPNAIDDQLND